MEKYSTPKIAEFTLVQNGMLCQSSEIQQNTDGLIYNMSIQDLSGDL